MGEEEEEEGEDWELVVLLVKREPKKENFSFLVLRLSIAVNSGNCNFKLSSHTKKEAGQENAELQDKGQQ